MPPKPLFRWFRRDNGTENSQESMGKQDLDPKGVTRLLETPIQNPSPRKNPEPVHDLRDPLARQNDDPSSRPSDLQINTSFRCQQTLHRNEPARETALRGHSLELQLDLLSARLATSSKPTTPVTSTTAGDVPQSAQLPLVAVGIKPQSHEQVASGVGPSVSSPYQIKGDINSEIAIWKELAEKHPSDRSLHDNLANARKEDIESEIAIQKELAEKNPSDRSLHDNLANAYRRKRDIDSKIAVRKELAEKHPSNRSLHDNLANAYQRKGDIDSEIAVRKELVEKHPYDL